MHPIEVSIAFLSTCLTFVSCSAFHFDFVLVIVYLDNKLVKLIINVLRHSIMQVIFVAITDMMLRKSFTMAKSAKKFDIWKAAQVNDTAEIFLMAASKNASDLEPIIMQPKYFASQMSSFRTPCNYLYV